MTENKQDGVFHNLSVREATRYVYPNIRNRTIYNWIEQGIFTPCVNVRTPAGPGQGTRLDRADLVTLGILHSMFTLGIRFSHFQPHDSTGPLLMVNFLQGLPPLGFGGLEESLCFSLGSRHIQKFLTEFDCKVYTYLQLYHANNKEQQIAATIHFWPHALNKITIDFVRWIEDSGKTPRVGHVILNIEEWAIYVQQMIVFHGLA